ncbi:hypothetical protein Tsp_02377 [Trichinella spiralis]|uniref:hypothetical protein n=1 Tax=Trichinella spiralis TaxID=6334 RepID=UPI0001EFD0A7|nr:hypothetical protein Tsp_02377 [Trichinella spiralis]
MKWKFFLFNLLLFINIQPLSSVTVKHSYPFDSYRITCPRGQAIQKASLQMIKSRGGQRTDFLITVYCDSILKLFPMKMKANQKLEEECRWTKVVNVKFPILFQQTCRDNEYLSGIMRRGTSHYSFDCIWQFLKMRHIQVKYFVEWVSCAVKLKVIITVCAMLKNISYLDKIRMILTLNTMEWW